MDPYLIGILAVGAALLTTVVIIGMLALQLRQVQGQLREEQKRADLLDGKWRRNYLSMASMVKAANSIEAAQADILRGPPEPRPELEPSDEERLADAMYIQQFGKNGTGEGDDDPEEMV